MPNILSRLDPNITNLDALNMSLAVIGEAPVASYYVAGVVDADMARDTLETTTRIVQAERWHFNSEENVTLPLEVSVDPEQNNRIVVPSNVIHIDTARCGGWQDVVRRGDYLYDRRNKSYQFSQPVTVDWTVLLPWDELPPAVRIYIAVRSARKFARRFFQDPQTEAYTAEDEMEARGVMLTEECESGDYNVNNDRRGWLTTRRWVSEGSLSY